MDSKRIWQAMCLLILMIFGLSVFRNWKLGAKLNQELNADTSTASGLARAYLQSSLSHAGTFLEWPNDLQLIDQEAHHSNSGYRLVLAFNETSCDLCRDEETRFAQQLARSHPDNVIMVIHAQQPRYVHSFIQRHQIQQPVLYDPTGNFFKQNGLQNTPVLLMINERDEVIAASVPISGQPWLSQPFHQIISRFMSRLN